jgi:Cof subfamily protein (haloacid dehalogenase superfamily)
MGPYKLIAIDLDGTLLLPNGEVSDRVRASVRRALDAGLLVCFATGRNWTESQPALDALNHYPTAVFVGGAMVVDTGRKITLHRMHMDPELARLVCQVLEDAGHAVLALSDRGEGPAQYLIGGSTNLNAATQAWMHITQAQVEKHASLADFEHLSTVRVGICAEPAEVEAAKQQLESRFGDRILCHNLQVPTYGVEVLEVFDPAVNKWEGIQHIARMHGITADEIVAIGDDLNDLPMITRAGLGVAMGNAREAVLEAADRVIGTNAEDGLAIFLDELVDQHLVERAN